MALLLPEPMKEPKFLFEINPPIAILLQVSERGREASAALFDESGKFASGSSSQPYGGEREREGGSIL